MKRTIKTITLMMIMTIALSFTSCRLRDRDEKDSQPEVPAVQNEQIIDLPQVEKPNLIEPSIDIGEVLPELPEPEIGDFGFSVTENGLEYMGLVIDSGGIRESDVTEDSCRITTSDGTLIESDRKRTVFETPSEIRVVYDGTFSTYLCDILITTADIRGYEDGRISYTDGLVIDTRDGTEASFGNIFSVKKERDSYRTYVNSYPFTDTPICSYDYDGSYHITYSDGLEVRIGRDGAAAQIGDVRFTCSDEGFTFTAGGKPQHSMIETFIHEDGKYILTAEDGTVYAIDRNSTVIERAVPGMPRILEPEIEKQEASEESENPDTEDINDRTEAPAMQESHVKEPLQLRIPKKKIGMTLNLEATTSIGLYGRDGIGFGAGFEMLYDFSRSISLGLSGNWSMMVINDNALVQDVDIYAAFEYRINRDRHSFPIGIGLGTSIRLSDKRVLFGAYLQSGYMYAFADSFAIELGARAAYRTDFRSSQLILQGARIKIRYSF